MIYLAGGPGGSGIDDYVADPGWLGNVLPAKSGPYLAGPAWYRLSLNPR